MLSGGAPASSAFGGAPTTQPSSAFGASTGPGWDAGQTSTGPAFGGAGVTGAPGWGAPTSAAPPTGKGVIIIYGKGGERLGVIIIYGKGGREIGSGHYYLWGGGEGRGGVINSE